jgi:hypothetical protein
MIPTRLGDKKTADCRGSEGKERRTGRVWRIFRGEKLLCSFCNCAKLSGVLVTVMRKMTNTVFFRKTLSLWAFVASSPRGYSRAPVHFEVLS